MCVKFRGSGIDYLSRWWIFDIGAVWITGAGCFLVQNKGGYRDVECNSGALASNTKRSELTGSEAFFTHVSVLLQQDTASGPAFLQSF